MQRTLLAHPLVGHSARGSILGCAYVLGVILVLSLRAIGVGSGNLVMLVFLSSLFVPLLYGLGNGGPALAFVMPLPLLVAFVLASPKMAVNEEAILLLPGFIGAAVGLYATGVRSTESYLAGPYPGYETNLLFVSGALLVTVAGLAATGALRWLVSLPLDQPADWGLIDAVVLIGVLVVLPAVGVGITFAYWVVWVRNRTTRTASEKSKL